MRFCWVMGMQECEVEGDVGSFGKARRSIVWVGPALRCTFLSVRGCGCEDSA